MCLSHNQTYLSLEVSRQLLIYSHPLLPIHSSTSAILRTTSAAGVLQQQLPVSPSVRLRELTAMNYPQINYPQNLLRDDDLMMIDVVTALSVSMAQTPISSMNGNCFSMSKSKFLTNSSSTLPITQLN